MIESATNIALSGLQAATKRIENSAHNIANQATPNFRPNDVVQTSQPQGGVETELRPRDPATTPVYQPENPAADSNGVVQLPNISQEEELVTQKMATYDAKAELKVIQAENETIQEVLNIIA